MTQRLEQLGPYTLVQREGVFPLGGDALALGGFATLRPRWRVCDLGTGSGALLLLLARREPTLDLWGLDSSQEAVDCTRESLDRSGLAGNLWAGPWSACPFPAGTFDLVVSNPPYFSPGRGKQGGPAGWSRRAWTLCVPPPPGCCAMGDGLPCATVRSGCPS